MTIPILYTSYFIDFFGLNPSKTNLKLPNFKLLEKKEFYLSPYFQGKKALSHICLGQTFQVQHQNNFGLKAFLTQNSISDKIDSL